MTIDSRLFVKISDLEDGQSLGATDNLAFVQDGVTLKISGQVVADSITELGNLASKAYVDAVVAGAPDLLNTLDELAAALNDDANFASNITTLIAGKVSSSDFNALFESRWSTKNTYHLPEGSNLYFTEQRVLNIVEPLIPSVPTDINQLTDVDGLLESGGTTLPVQTGNAGKVLTTDGTNLSWTTVSAGSNPTFNTVNATTLNVQNVSFTGTGAVTITSGNDLNFVAAGQVTINGETFISLEDLKSVVALSTDFANFKTRIAGL
jgi:hypothetical protein